jgi:hypothetical protein
MLSRRARAPVFFVDDIAQHHGSVAQAAPRVLRIHLVGDPRLRALLVPTPHAQLQTGSWPEAAAFVRARLKGERFWDARC